MTLTFNCPHCNAAKADARFAGKAADCPGCGERFIIPGAQKQTQPPAIPGESTKRAEDYAVDAICTTARGFWKATKVVAPVVGGITGKVALRAANAAAPHVKKAFSPPPNESGIEKTARVGNVAMRLILKLLGG